MADTTTLLPTGTAVTEKGYKLIMKLLGKGAELHFTRAAVGTGTREETVPIETLTGLIAFRMDAEIADYGLTGDDQAYVDVQLSSEGTTEGFSVTEVGLFAEDPDEGEILYAYLDLSGDPTYIYAEGDGSIVKYAEFSLFVLVGETQQISAVVTPRSFVTGELLERKVAMLRTEIADKTRVLLGAEDTVLLNNDMLFVTTEE